MHLIKTIVIALAFTVGSPGVSVAKACPNCPEHAKKTCDCAKKGASCDCAKKGASCDCAKKDASRDCAKKGASCDCAKKGAPCDCQKKAPPKTK